MRFNRLCLKFALPCALLLLPLLSCDRTDVLTDVGGSVVVGDDPTQAVGPWRGFARVTLDALYNHQGSGQIVDSAYSLPAARDPMFATYAPSNGMLIGVSDENDTVAAHIQYKVRGGAYKSSDGDTTIVFKTAFIYFRSTDTYDKPITLFKSRNAKLGTFDPVNKDDDLEDNIAVGGRGFYLRGADGGDSLNLTGAGGIDQDIESALLYNKDTNSVYNFAVSIVGYTEKKILKLDNPYIVVTLEKKFPVNDNDTTINLYDTIRGSARYTVFENLDETTDKDNNVKARAQRPYSSQLTRRTAVFRINMEKVFDELGDSAKKTWLPIDVAEVMNAVVAVKPNKSASKNPGTYSALILDTPLSDEIKSAVDTSRLLRYKFEKVKSTGIKEPYNTHDFKAVLRNVVEEYIRQSAQKNNLYKPYIYVYLRPVTEYSVIEWGKDSNCANCGAQKVETVFTHSR